MPPGGGISLSVTARDLIRSGLFGKDFDTYVSEIVDYLRLRFGSEIANNIVASEQGIVMIEMVAFALSTMSWYGDRQADDTNLVDVRIRSAGVTIARQLGYKPYASVAPAVEITITLDSVPPANLTIEKGRKLNGPNGLIFETTEEVVFDAGDVGPKTFAARQGQTLQAIYTSSGEPNQVFLVTTVPSGSAIAQDSPEVTVDALDWTEQDFLTFDQTNQFEFQYGFNPPRLLFGDGVAGNIPRKDAEIRLLFFVTDGTGGSVPANTVVTFTEPLVCADSTVVSATLVHNLPSTPGSNPESLASIKTNAPLTFQAAQRAVTQADLDGWINSFVDPTYGAVAIGRATVPRSVDQDAAALTIIQAIENAGLQDVADDARDYWNDVLSSNCQANVVVAQILSSDIEGRYVEAPSGLARALEVFLEDKAESTVGVHVTDGSINLLSVDLAVEIKSTLAYSSSELQQTVVANVRSALTTQLIGRKYGVSLRISDLYSVVEAIEGVDYAHVSITNQPTRVNSYGDLPIESYEVITLGVSPVITLL
jgi:hypothetical protein